MTRVIRVAVLLGTFFLTAVPGLPQATSQKPAAPAQNPPDEANPPEEDESLVPEKLPFNPMEAERSLKVGNYYSHKGKYRAALKRYEMATKYNPSSQEAFFRVGETEQKLKNTDAARLAFQKVIQLGPDTKFAQEAKKKLSSKG